MCQVDCPTIVLQTAEQNLDTIVKALGRTSGLILRGLGRAGWELGAGAGSAYVLTCQVARELFTERK